MTRSQRIVIAGLILFAIGFAGWLLRANQPPFAPLPRQEATATIAAMSTAVDMAGVVGVFVEPEDERAPILAELAAAERSIDLEVYLLSDDEIIEALIDAAARGVRVRVLLEEHPFGGSGKNPDTFERLQGAGVEVRWSNPVFRFSHVKMFVVDDEAAIVMNLNLSRSAFTDNREFAAITTRRGEVEQASAIFAADWDRLEEPNAGPLVVSPTNSRQTLLSLIENAQSSLDVYAEVMRDEQIIEAFIEAEARGVEVRLVVSPEYSDEGRGERERARLSDAGVEVRLARGVYIHAKAIIVDGITVWLGSQNFTATSLDQNREVGIIIDDTVNVSRVRGVFETDFTSGRPG